MRAAERARQASLIACAAGASILVLYIAGHARMAAVNYQRVKISAQVRDLRAANDRLHSEIIGASGKASVAAWAKAHGMVLESRDPFTLSR